MQIRFFRLGLKACLEQMPDLQVIAEADSPAQVLMLLSPPTEPVEGEWVTPLRASGVNPQSLDLIIVDMGSATDPEANAILCQQLKARYPDLTTIRAIQYHRPRRINKIMASGGGRLWRQRQFSNPKSNPTVSSG